MAWVKPGLKVHRLGKAGGRKGVDMDWKEWLKKNATLKDGAKLEDLEGLITDLDPLKNIKTADEAIAFMDRNPVFVSAVSKIKTDTIEKHDAKFTKEKLPKLLKEREDAVRKEFNKEETPEQKRIRELEERDQQREAAFQMNERKAALRDIASELKIDHKLAERYVVFGDDAEKTLRADVEERKAAITAAVDAAKKEIYGDNEPPKGREIPEEKILSREAFDKMNPADRMNAVKDGMVIQD
jgi:hypothetical protein